ncbi:hypothetical protein QR680_005867 [Steinernema hermaphroditum]|uniref:Fungal lipase-type domain-containing protein n=1 Tax=Steinernema hermaphroditum TaxID=289476 RepID=A0AA39HVZ0_9BILA|nr:hypothetical protein QR680_005867 [Steinernema hermaphroditum]
MKFLVVSASLLLLFLLSEAKECEDLRSCTACTKSEGVDGIRCDWCTQTNSCTKRLSRSCPKKFRVGAIPYNCPVEPPVDVRYNETFVKQFAFPLIALAPETSHTRLERILKCSLEGIQLIGSYHVSCNSRGSSDSTCFGFTAVLPSQKAIVISFRGSVGIPQLMSQARDFAGTPTADFAPTGGRVMSYYKLAFLSVWGAGMSADVHKLSKKFPDYEVWSLGLSLGGAIASLASTQVVSEGIVPSRRIKLITLGQPRVGNVEWAEAHDRMVPYSFRIISAKDPIPAVGKGRAHHHRYEVWYPNGMKDGNEYRISTLAEDRSGFLSAAHHDAYDHLFYYGHDLTTYYRDFRCPGERRSK